MSDPIESKFGGREALIDSPGGVIDCVDESHGNKVQARQQLSVGLNFETRPLLTCAGAPFITALADSVWVSKLKESPT
jgi:hypothetical protein